MSLLNGANGARCLLHVILQPDPGTEKNMFRLATAENNAKDLNMILKYII